MTETGMNTSNPLHGERRAGTVGLPLPGVTVRICDANNRVLGTRWGRCRFAAPMCSAATGMLEQTAQDFTPDGFFNTGDQASIDEEGYVSIVGRSKDMVITGGLNVYPKEIEH